MLRRIALVTAPVATVVAMAACGSSSVVTITVTDAGAGDADAQAEGCPPGEYRSASDAVCTRGGFAACFEGTRTRPTGWGCEAIVADTACAGATREVLGKPECVPVGDCDAAFPPAGATLFVSKSAPPDATHFTSIADAVAAAPAGAVIAVDRGDYTGSVRITKPVTLVGRCPAQVSLVGALPDPGIKVEGTKATIRGITVKKTVVGISLGIGGDVVLEDAVLDDNTLVGISLSDGQAKLEASRIVVRNTKPSNGGDRGTGINVQASSTFTLRDATFAGNGSQNVRVSSGSTGTLERVVLRDGKPTPASDFGRGLQIQDGAKVTMTRAALLDNYDIGIVAGDRTTLDLTDVVVARTKIVKTGFFGRALNAFGGAVVKGQGVHLHDNHDASVMVAESPTLVTLRRSSVVDTALDRDGYVGRGITVQEGGAFEGEEIAVVSSHEVAVAVFNQGTRASLKRSIVLGTGPNAGDYFGHGAMVTLGGVLVVEDAEVAGNTGFGIAVGDGAAQVTRTRIRKNQVGLYVQEGTAVREIAASSGGPLPQPREVTVSADCVFEENASRLTAGTVPLPEPARLLAP